MKSQINKKIESLASYCQKNNIDLFLVSVEEGNVNIVTNGISGVICDAIVHSPEDMPKDIAKMATAKIIENEIIEKYKQ